VRVPDRTDEIARELRSSEAREALIGEEEDDDGGGHEREESSDPRGPPPRPAHLRSPPAAHAGALEPSPEREQIRSRLAEEARSAAGRVFG